MVNFGSKSVQKLEIESKFENHILAKVKPSVQIINIAEAILQKKHEKRVSQILIEQQSKNMQKARIENQISTLVKKLANIKIIVWKKLLKEKSSYSLNNLRN